MKKIFLTIIAALTVLSFAACEPTTNVKWRTAYDPDAAGDNPSVVDNLEGITDIQWQDETASADTSWNEQLVDSGQETSSKTVGILTGSPVCLLDGADATLDISPSSSGIKGDPNGGSVTLEEGVDATLLIDSATKK